LLGQLRSSDVDDDLCKIEEGCNNDGG
jgi:hypothetical protein